MRIGLVFIVLIEFQHELGQLLRLRQRNGIVERGTYAAH